MAVKSYSPTRYFGLQKALIYPSHEYHEWVRFWLRFQAAPLLGRVPRPAPQLGAESGTSRLSRPKTWVQMYGAFDVRTFRDTKFESHGHRRVFKVFRCEISKLKNCLFRQVRNDTNTQMLIFATPLKAMEKGKGINSAKKHDVCGKMVTRFLVAFRWDTKTLYKKERLRRDKDIDRNKMEQDGTKTTCLQQAFLEGMNPWVYYPFTTEPWPN